jgi:hypothetical protein
MLRIFEASSDEALEKRRLSSAKRGEIVELLFSPL